MSQTPAGWYPDAHDPHLLRWWDGSAWTAHTHSAERATAQGCTRGEVADRPEQRTSQTSSRTYRCHRPDVACPCSSP